MDVRPYLPSDRDACLAIFDSNSPEFFKSHGRGDFEEFLDGPGGNYFVMEHEGAVIGCGGYIVAPEKTLARLVWGIVGRDWRRQGLGRFLLLFRLREITKAGGVEMVHLDTPPDSAPFFRSQGFKVARVEKDGYAPGLDRLEMTMKLTVCR
jgi:ribosomal protein S18 acetylase RimI-like enzyme